MDVATYLLMGFQIALTPVNLFYCFLGVFLGTLIGVLPGLGPTAGMAILIPVSTGLPATTAIIMLAGLYYGAMYGGSTTAILINTPGEAASVPATLDGYAMARQGRAGPALGMAAISSFVAGTVSIVLLMFLAPPLASVALSFGSPEYFALMAVGLTIVINLAGKSLVKGLVSGSFGIFLGTVGLDVITGQTRFTYGNAHLMGGIDFIPVVVGLFAIAEVISNLEQEVLQIYETRITQIWPNLEDLRRCTGAMIRGTFIGFFIGVLPGGSGSVAAFMAYDVERRLSKHPERFGTGVIEGVAAPEGANNSAAGGGLVPLLTLGIPTHAVFAVLLGAFIIHGLRPGPLLFQEKPEFVWALIASMYIGNVMLLVLNLPLVGMWVRLCQVPYPLMAPAVLVLCLIGTYTVQNSLFDVWVAMGFGVLGYLMRKLEFPAAPVVLGQILSGMMETALRQSLILSEGSVAVFFTRPVSLTLIVVAVVATAGSAYSRWRQRKSCDAFIEAISS